jgi:hypothetical protein
MNWSFCYVITDGRNIVSTRMEEMSLEYKPSVACAEQVTVVVML